MSQSDANADIEEVANAKPGFLPIETNRLDRLFIWVVLWAGLSLLWLRFLEPFGLSIWICAAISLILAAIIIRKG